MGVSAGLCMYDVVVKSSRSLSHLLMSSCPFCHKRYSHETATVLPSLLRTKCQGLIGLLHLSSDKGHKNVSSTIQLSSVCSFSYYMSLLYDECRLLHRKSFNSFAD